jgi:hypothetical protein
MPDYPPESQIPADAATTAKDEAARLTALGTLEQRVLQVATYIRLLAPEIIEGLVPGLAAANGVGKVAMTLLTAALGASSAPPTAPTGSAKA